MAPIKTPDDQPRSGKLPPRKAIVNLIPVLVAIALLVAGAWAGMESVFAWIFKAWWSFAGVGVYSHGYLVLGMSAWMGWAYWRSEPPQCLAPNWWALIPLLGLVGLLALMELLYIDSSRALLVPLLILALIALVFGRPASWRLAMAVLFLYAGLLPWWMLNPLLQNIATSVVESLISLVSVPAYIEGNFIHVPAGVFEIASACSGLSFFLTAVSLAVFYAAMYLRRWRSRGLLLLVAAGAALVSNWIRIWTLVLIGNYTVMEHWLVREHYAYGWALFVIALAPVLFFAKWLEDRDLASEANGESAGGPGREDGGRTSGQVRIVKDDRLSAQPDQVPSVANAVIIAAAVGALLLTVPRAFVGADISVANATDPLPLPARLGVVEQVVAYTDWRPLFANAREGRASYGWQDTTVHVYRAVYPEQNRWHHLFLRGNRVVEKRWRSTGRSIEVVGKNGDRMKVVEYRGHLSGREYLVWTWYEVAGQAVTSRLVAKLVEAGSMVQGRSRRDGVAMAMAIECDLDCDIARVNLQKFIQTTYAGLQWQPGMHAEP